MLSFGQLRGVPSQLARPPAGRRSVPSAVSRWIISAMGAVPIPHLPRSEAIRRRIRCGRWSHQDRGRRSSGQPARQSFGTAPLTVQAAPTHDLFRDRASPVWRGQRRSHEVRSWACSKSTVQRRDSTSRPDRDKQFECRPSSPSHRPQTVILTSRCAGGGNAVLVAPSGSGKTTGCRRRFSNSLSLGVIVAQPRRVAVARGAAVARSRGVPRRSGWLQYCFETRRSSDTRGSS